MDGEDVIYPCIPLALTFDPRAMSTANAAKFLRDLCQALENFGLLLIK
jgi:pyruvate/2-oxoglutarate dehydrogenase complex dihydrolipoamide acyltransferase (E2) component